MWILYVVGALGLGLLALLLSPVVIQVQYEEDLTVKARFWFFSVGLVPLSKSLKKLKKKKKKPKKKEDGASSENAKKAKKPSALKKMLQEDGLMGTLESISDILGHLGSSGLYLLKDARVRNMEVVIGVTGADAADAAISYGQVCSVFYPLLGAFAQIVKLKKPQVNVYCDYVAEQPIVRAKGTLYISVYHVVTTALLVLYKFVFKK